MGPPEFESGSPAPQAGRMDQSTPRPRLISVKWNNLIDQIYMRYYHSFAAVSSDPNLLKNVFDLFHGWISVLFFPDFINFLFKVHVIRSYDPTTRIAPYRNYHSILTCKISVFSFWHRDPLVTWASFF